MTNKLFIVATVMLLSGCNGLDRLINGKESEPTVPATTEAPAPTPTPTPVVFNNLLPLPDGTVLPVSTLSAPAVLAGLLEDAYVNRIEVALGESHQVFVRRTSSGLWYKAVYNAGPFSSAVRYTLIDGGIQVSHTDGLFDAVCIYHQ